MINKKSRDEIKRMPHAGHIVALVHKKMKEVIEPGISTKELDSIAMQIITQEKQARAALIKDEDYLDRIYRAYGILKSAYKLTSKELINLVSYVRVGVSEGILSIPTEKLREMTVVLQPATLNAQSDRALTQTERDILRSQKVREELA